MDSRMTTGWKGMRAGKCAAARVGGMLVEGGLTDK